MTTDPSTSEICRAVSSALPQDSHSISRRRFLQAAAATGGVLALPTAFADLAEAAVPLGAGDGVMVFIIMAGGNDGLNTVVPIGNGAYYDRRGSLALRRNETIPISDDRAFHNALPALKTHWDRGDVAVIDGVGVPGIDLSHFTSMAKWQAGRAGAGIATTGWLGRYVDGLGGRDPFHSVAVGSQIPLAMQGQRQQATGLPPSAAGEIFGTGGDHAIYANQYQALANFADANTGLGALGDRVAQSEAIAVDVSGKLEPHVQENPPDGPLAAQLDLVARLINANLGIRVFTVQYGDFDSHANQRSMHGARMEEFNRGIEVFYQRLNSSFAARTLLLTMSEFGRRVKANGSGGTDHGAGSTVLAIGQQVKGGFYGELPSLTALDRQGNLKPTVDFRSVYATTLGTWMGADASGILGHNYENLGFLAAPARSRTTGGLDPRLSSSIPRRRAQVVRVYLACLDRLPDNAGLNHWVGALGGGVALADVADTLMSSEEFRQKFGSLSNQAFVEQLYQNVLGRRGDAAGVAHWTSQLDAGGRRGAVVVGFSESKEFVERTKAQVEHVDGTGPVARLYRAYFNRPPDAKGLAYWISTGAGLDAISEAFAHSAEFQKRYGSLDDAGFVELVYRNVLGRRPDANGRRYWAGLLRRGTPRGVVMTGFSESDEFVKRTGTRR